MIWGSSRQTNVIFAQARRTRFLIALCVTLHPGTFSLRRRRFKSNYSPQLAFWLFFLGGPVLPAGMRIPPIKSIWGPFSIWGPNFGMGTRGHFCRSWTSTKMTPTIAKWLLHKVTRAQLGSTAELWGVCWKKVSKIVGVSRADHIWSGNISPLRISSEPIALSRKQRLDIIKNLIH